MIVNTTDSLVPPCSNIDNNYLTILQFLFLYDALTDYSLNLYDYANSENKSTIGVNPYLVSPKTY